MTFKNLSVKRLFGWVVAGLFLFDGCYYPFPVPYHQTDGDIAGRGYNAAMCVVLAFSADADIWKTPVLVYFLLVPNPRPHD